MWTSDLFSVASPRQQQKHQAIADFDGDESLSPRSDCSSRSESPIPADPISPQRSIFGSYWSSKSSVDEEQLSRSLCSLQMPLVTADDENTHPAETGKEHEAPPKDDQKDTPRKLCITKDDTAIPYRLPPAPDRSPMKRRQILPTPPKSVDIPKPSCTKPCCRPWSSTSALIRKPSGSCLRPSRYSFSGSSSAACLDDVDAVQAHTQGPSHPLNKKGVSFYAQVSVFEFTVPQEQSSDGWSNYFF